MRSYFAFGLVLFPKSILVDVEVGAIVEKGAMKALDSLFFVPDALIKRLISF